MPLPFWAYILRCADGSYYTGHTDLLERRVGQHNLGLAAAHTKHRRPVTLVWCQEFPTRLEALGAERRIKGWSRAKKEALIAGDWELLSLLSRAYSVAGRVQGDQGGPYPVRAEPVEARPSAAVAGRPSTSSGRTEKEISSEQSSKDAKSEQRS